MHTNDELRAKLLTPEAIERAAKVLAPIAGICVDWNDDLEEEDREDFRVDARQIIEAAIGDGK